MNCRISRAIRGISLNRLRYAPNETLACLGRTNAPRVIDIAIKEIEGVEDQYLDAYAESESEKNLEMIEVIRRHLKLSSLKFQKMNDLVVAIGLPKEKLCTHCWDGSSYF